MAESVEGKLNTLVARVGKVRRWLVALAVLKVAALCLVFVSLYIGVYAWLDHRLNFDEIGRITAFILLVAGLGLLLHRLAKLLLGHVSCSAAANYVENRRSFDQQLVTAIEYYENKQDYPYSKALAEELVLQVDRESREFKFDSTVAKWQGGVLAAIVLFGLVAAWFYVRDNYVYFSSYFARLTRPLASVEPVSATSLEPITKDIIAEPDSKVKFAAEIKGRVPEFGKLVLVELKPEAADDGPEQKSEEMQIRSGFDDKEAPRFEASRSFPETGRFKYRFEADSASTDWCEVNICQAPGIESMMANVTLPKRTPRRRWVKPYTEQIDSNTLQVIPRSSVTLNVQADDKLKEVVVTGLDGKQITKQLNGAEQFTFNFTADQQGTIKFHLVNDQGLANDNLPDLEVIVKADEPPKFKLISPDGDYLATNVASVPITFEVTDDFGLDSVRMCLEIPGQQPKELAIPVAEGARSKEFTHTVELESYELTVGDSILFYAEANDVDTGSERANRTSSSDVYFIEIRPYRQDWVPMPGGGESQAGGSPPVELLNILEYARAILKKTWAIASKPELTEQDRSRLGFIEQDVQYCGEQLALIRDDSQYGFEEPHKAVLNEIIRYYEQASRYLAAHEAVSAMVPEKSAYRVLRKFILELELAWSPPSSGQGQQPKKPDSVKLQEKPEFTGYEKERVEGQLKKMQQELDKLTREQKELQWSFENFLEQQAEEKKQAENKQDDRPSGASAEEQAEGERADKQQGEVRPDQKGKSASERPGSDDDRSPAGSQEDSDSRSTSEDQSGSEGQNASEGQSGSQGQSASEGQSSSQGQSASEGQSSSQGQSASKGQSASQGQSASKGQNDTQGQAGGRPSAANTDARLRMLQAKQGALQEDVSQLKQDLLRLPEISENAGNEGRAEVKKHLDEAVAKMDDFQARLAEARYQAYMDRETSNEAVELMDLAKSELDLAREALEGELTLSDDQKIAKQAQEMAEQLVEGADALDDSVTAVEREEMLARLEAAKRLLKMMPEPQWATVDRGAGATSGASHVFTRGPNLGPAEAAREMARQFWSIAISAKKRERQLLEDESSDVKFYGQENEFFENAAKFDQEAAEK